MRWWFHTVLLCIAIVKGTSGEDPLWIESTHEPEVKVTQAEITQCFINIDEEIKSKPLKDATYEVKALKVYCKGCSRDVTLEVKKNDNVVRDVAKLDTSSDPDYAQLILEKPLDWEQANLYYFTFKYSGWKQGGMCTIDVIDVNDQEPSFVEQYIQRSQKENKANSSLAILKVIDNDDPKKEAIEFKFEDPKDNELFTLTPLEKDGDIYRAELSCDKLDYETTFFYTIVIVATDRDGPNQHERTCKVYVDVLDQQDKDPRWINVKTNVNVPENLKPGSEVLNITAEDGDSKDIRRDISYKLIEATAVDGTDVKEYLAMETVDNVGFLNIKKMIDREKLTEKIVAKMSASEIIAETGKDGPTIETVSNIYIDDLNDNLPEFDKDTYAVTISEDILKDMDTGISLIVTDPDSEDRGTYSVLVADEYSEVFSITPHQGTMETTFHMLVKDPTALDYEDTITFSFLLKAAEVKDSSRFTEANVTVTLTDANDCVPYFDPPTYEVDILEDMKNEKIDITLVAKDDDKSLEFGTKSLVYQKLSQYSDLFSITEAGEISVMGDLDFENEPTTYDLMVTVYDHSGGYPFKQNTTTVTVNIKDVNDEKPTINIGEGDYNVTEGDDPGSEIIGDIVIDDPDSTAKIKYDIDWEKTKAWKTKLNSEEVSLEEYDFSKCFVFKAAEESNTIGLVVVGEMSPDYEKIDLIQLSLKVTDTETDEKFMDKSTDSVNVRITIEDTLDTPPEFYPENKDYSTSDQFEIRENEGSTKISMKIEAQDPDEDDDITFEIIAYDPESMEGSLKVYVEQESSIFKCQLGPTEKNIDREALHKETGRDNFTITLNITDSMGLTNSTEITISVSDENDNDPVFSNESNNGTMDIDEIAESKDERTDIIQFIATDEDGPEYLPIVYILDVGTTTNDFAIDEKTGWLYLKPNMTLPWKQDETSIVFKIKAMDCNGQTGTRSGSWEFNLNVVDINNWKPVLHPSETWEIEETAKKDKKVGTVEADDYDNPKTDNANLKYSIMNQTTDNLFRIDTEKPAQGDLKVGVIYVDQVTGNFDKDTLYQITVKVEDADHECEEPVTYFVTIKDVNDNPPKLVSKNFTANESVVVQLDGFLTATDEDSCSDFEYHLIAEDVEASGKGCPGDQTWCKTDIISETFRVSTEEFESMAKGVINLNRELDYDTFHKYKLPIRVEDNGNKHKCEGDSLSSTGTVFVSVYNQDNESPYFPDPPYPPGCDVISFEEEDGGLNKEEGFCTAVDPDDGDTVSYEIYGGQHKDYFEISEATKEKASIKLIKKLDRETLKEYEVIVVATDGFSNSYSDPLPLTVKADDINDNDPVFDKERMVAGIDESTTVDSQFMELPAKDKDENTELFYKNITEMKHSNPSLDNVADPPFIIKQANTDKTKGVVEIKFQPNDDMTGFFSFDVNVTDKDGKSSTGHVQINLVGKDDKLEFQFEDEFKAIKDQEKEIGKIFTDALEYNCNVERSSPTTDDDGNKIEGFTSVFSHFVTEDESVVPGSTIKGKIQSASIATKLKNDFKVFNLHWRSVGGVTPDSTTTGNEKLYKILLIGISSGLGVLLITIIIIHFLQISSKNLKIKSLSATAFGSQDSGLDKAGQLPNTNMFSAEGENPMYGVDDDDDNHYKYDAQSVSSGDSVLIGVEDNPEFGNTQYPPLDLERPQGSYNPMFNSPELPVDAGFTEDEGPQIDQQLNSNFSFAPASTNL